MNDLSKNLNWQNLAIGAVLSILAGLAFFVVPTDVAADSRFGGALVVALWLFFFGYPYTNCRWRLGKRSHI
jgi:hypothetical protein